jgi:hypothetical protein
MAIIHLAAFWNSMYSDIWDGAGNQIAGLSSEGKHWLTGQSVSRSVIY